MVFPDFSSDNKIKKTVSEPAPAPLLDRFFALVIDHLVISPFVLFVLYMTFNNGFRFWKAHPSAPENNLFLVLAAVVYVLYFSLVQSLFVAFHRATPGQYFLKMRMHFHDSESFLFFRAWLRQLGFWGSFLFLGIPFFSVMTNRSRRTFYDRISDVSLVTLKNEQRFFGFEKEYRYWQSFMVTLTLFVAFLFSALIWRNYERVVERSASVNEMQGQNYFCRGLEEVRAADRLPVAIALNLVQQLSDECLNREADFVLWKQKGHQYSLAYYAKSVIATDPQRQTLYRQQACQGEDTEDYTSLSLGCRASVSFAEDRMDRLYASLGVNSREPEFLSDVLKYELGMMLGKKNDERANFAKIATHKELKAVKKYMITVLLQAPKNSERSPASDEETNSDADILSLLEEL